MRILIFLLILGCSTNNSDRIKNTDEFDNIIAVMKTRNVDELIKVFGPPDNRTVEELSYKETAKHSTITAYLDKDKKISRIWVFYWKDFDNYTALKKRFKSYTWKEKKIADNSKSDVLTDLYLVSVPELNMTFEYDNYAPQRKIMWIYFN
ncbi:MAG TPA: hypothetical protein VNJ08_05210 [Bacteriovoracaceae bacterium]|nr:hypothetical protein [Bacteriovoracaceae bacterium]